MLGRTVKIALAFVGLLVGAGFATGREVIQYFLSFGAVGFWGAALAGVIMTVTGAVIIQLGSFFLADDHNAVFRRVSRPVLSRILDASVTLTLFTIGFIMFAGAGSTLDQQFGLPTWVGAGLMALLVMATGLLDVDKVSAIISTVTPLIVVAVVLAFGVTVAHLPGDVTTLEHLAVQTPSPIEPWWLSALNYAGLALLLGVSMCLVIGGNNPDPRSAGLGGLAGGALYTVLLLMQAVVMYAHLDQVRDASVPMLTVFTTIWPWSGVVIVSIVVAMIYNTAIGLFYALGRRLTARRPHLYAPVFLTACVLGYGLSFVGFDTLMAYAYPALGYLGVVMVATLLVAWVTRREPIAEETRRRGHMRDLLIRRAHPRLRFGRAEAVALEDAATDSPVESGKVIDALDRDVAKTLDTAGSAEDALTN